MQHKKKLLRITTVPIAIAYPLRGQPNFMHNNGFDVLLVSAEGSEWDLVKQQETCPYVIVPMTRSITPLKDIRSLYLLIKLIKQQKPDIVHTETPKAGLLGMLAAWFCRVNVRIHTVAGLPLMVEKGVKLWLLKIIEKITYAAATNVWPNSPSLKNYILQHRFCSPKKLTVIGKGSSNGIDTKRFCVTTINPVELSSIKKSISYDDQNKYLLFVGRMVLDKGIVELVHAFTKIQQQNPSLRLILAGQFEKSLDPLPKDIEDAIHHHPAIIHIDWTNKVEYYMALSHFFVFPSYREGFPNVLLEAALMKLPILCSKIYGNVDIVEHQKTGLLFESHDENALSEQLKWALQNPTQIKVMADKLYDDIVTTFPREIFWETMKLEYDKLTS